MSCETHTKKGCNFETTYFIPKSPFRTICSALAGVCCEACRSVRCFAQLVNMTQSWTGPFRCRCSLQKRSQRLRLSICAAGNDVSRSAAWHDFGQYIPRNVASITDAYRAEFAAVALDGAKRCQVTYISCHSKCIHYFGRTRASVKFLCIGIVLLLRHELCA